MLSRKLRISHVLTLWSALASLVATAVEAATIQGQVRYTGIVDGPTTVAVTSNQYVCGDSAPAEDLLVSPEGGIRNAVVSLQTPPPDAGHENLGVSPQIDQEKCVFIPRIVLVPVGGTVEFLNSDRLLHNIRSKDIKHNSAFNRTQPRGRTVPITFAKPEIVQIGCDLHPWMRSWVVVTGHPFFSVTDDAGRFVLTDVPAGEYTLEIWQEALGKVRRDVTVTDDAVTTVVIEMPPR